MMNASEIISKVGSLKPNPYENELEIFLKAIELRIKSEMFFTENPTYDPDHLSLDSPHETIYILFLISLIDYLNGEYTSFANTSAEFNAEWNRIAKIMFNNKPRNKMRISLW